MKRLLDELIIPVLSDNEHNPLHDASLFAARAGSRLAMTTDSFVVKPMEFPGGDIGCLSIYGTVNDLAMAGAHPAYLSLGLIIEEGLEMTTLLRMLQSMRRAADEVGVRIITGDTKVVDRGKGDGLYINTAGIGYVAEAVDIQPGRIKADDIILVSGDLGRHGIAVMAQREGLAFETTLESDCASLVQPVHKLLDAGIGVHCLRDLTRGGLTSALNELALSSGFSFELNENSFPVNNQVRAACELLGLDPLYVACEGRFTAILPESQASQALDILGEQACVIGRVVQPAGVPVYIRNAYGGRRVLDMLSGEQLPRIC